MQIDLTWNPHYCSLDLSLWQFKVSKSFFLSESSIPVFCFYIFLLRHPLVILSLSDYSHSTLPFEFLLCPTLFLLFAQKISDDNAIYLPCAILELSGAIPESADKVGIPSLRRTIPELYRFLLCAQHIYTSQKYYLATFKIMIET